MGSIVPLNPLFEKKVRGQTHLRNVNKCKKYLLGKLKLKYYEVDLVWFIFSLRIVCYAFIWSISFLWYLTHGSVIYIMTNKSTKRRKNNIITTWELNNGNINVSDVVNFNNTWASALNVHNIHIVKALGSTTIGPRFRAKVLMHGSWTPVWR